MTFTIGAYFLMAVICSLLGLGASWICCLINKIDDGWIQTCAFVVLSVGGAVLMVASARDTTGTDILVAGLITAMLSVGYIVVSCLVS